MAGDWLKLEASTPDKPEVLAITATMGWDDPDLTVGKLFRVWRWFDQQTTDGNAHGVTSALLDRIAGVSGFAQAMQKVGWLIVSADGLELPNFEKHNGATAKSRAQTAKRVASHRASEPSNAESNAPTVTPALAREEKRREEKKEKKENTAPLCVAPSVLIEAGFSPEVAAEFIAHKSRHKAPLTERAWADHLSESLKAGWTPLQAAEKVMAKAWKGFEAKYVASEAPSAKPLPQSFYAADVAAKRAIGDAWMGSAKPVPFIDMETSNARIEMD